MTDIQYPFAIDENGKNVKAESLTKATSRGHSFRCPLCNEEMVPVLGNVRIHHFRHLGTLCQKDAYLHACAESVFMEEYQKCLDEGLPFYLELPVPAWCNRSCVLAEHENCKERYNRKIVDLTLDYKRISKETRVDIGDNIYRRPDILLQTEDEKMSLWIEFFVTHAVDEIKKKCGRIIEIKINSEIDIDTIIRGHKIVQSDDEDHWVKLYNISTIVIDEPLEHKPHCDEFFVYEVRFGSRTHRIVDKVPSKADGFLYRIALRLNWLGNHDDEGDIARRLSIGSLHRWCEDRYMGRNQQDVDEQIKLLIGYEYRSKDLSSYTNSLKSSTKPVPVSTQENNHEISIVNWIDMGLPSGILWADVDGPPEDFADDCMLPSRANIHELKSFCTQEVVNGSLKIIGPNGNSITLEKGQYRLSSQKNDDCVEMVSIYALSGGNYLHIFEDNSNSKHLFRCVLLK